MRIVVQRCARAEVRIAGTVVGKIGQGFMLLVGITDTDWKSIADSTIITGGCCKKLNKEELLDILIECK